MKGTSRNQCFHHALSYAKKSLKSPTPQELQAIKGGTLVHAASQPMTEQGCNLAVAKLQALLLNLDYFKSSRIPEKCCSVAVADWVIQSFGRSGSYLLSKDLPQAEAQLCRLQEETHKKELILAYQDALRFIRINIQEFEKRSEEIQIYSQGVANRTQALTWHSSIQRFNPARNVIFHLHGEIAEDQLMQAIMNRYQENGKITDKDTLAQAHKMVLIRFEQKGCKNLTDAFLWYEKTKITDNVYLQYLADTQVLLQERAFAMGASDFYINQISFYRQIAVPFFMERLGYYQEEGYPYAEVFALAQTEELMREYFGLAE